MRPSVDAIVNAIREESPIPIARTYFDPHLDFFSMGYSSAQLTVLAFKLSERFASDLSVIDILENDQPIKLARFIAKALP